MRKTPNRWIPMIVACTLGVGGLVAGPSRVARADTPYDVPVMGQPILNANQLAAWYQSKHKPFNVPGINVTQLAAIFIAEGAQENIRGDLAFAQSVVETGYFGFAGSMVKPENYNFAGMGACDSCNSGRQFPDPATGVRAQVQHLRNYADINSRAANLRHPPVPQWYAWPSLNPSTAASNFNNFFAKGRAPTWNRMGSGNWATSTHYSSVVISVYQSMLAFVGLPGIAAAGGDPFGNVDMIARVPGGVRVRGWTVDPSGSASNPVDIYVNGVMAARINAGLSRPDVAAAFPGVGARHGFNAVVPSAGGRVCAYAINVGVGTQNPLLGCRTTMGADPLGTLDRVARGPDGVHVSGWALDPDAGGPVSVDLYANGVMVARISAGTTRADVGKVYPRYGSNHGFDAVLPGTGGRVCAYAINVGRGSRNTALGCRNVMGPDPLGTLDRAVRESNGVRVSGWALDPDFGGPVSVDVYANGVMVARISAGAARADVGQVYPAYGPNHGFDTVVPSSGGRVCAYAINVGGGSQNSALGCHTV